MSTDLHILPKSELTEWLSAEQLQVDDLQKKLADKEQTEHAENLRADKSRIKVLESAKTRACHQGWYWVYIKIGSREDITYLAC